MAGSTRSGLRIILFILLIAVLFLGGLLWFDFLGIIDVKYRFAPVLKLIGIETPQKIENSDDMLLLDRERLDKQLQALDIRAEELDKRENEIALKEAEVKQKLETLTENEKSLVEREKSFNDRLKAYEDRDRNLRQSSAYFTGMPPGNAVERLLGMDDQDIIDIFRTTELIAKEAGTDSIVSYWFSLMPSDRAAELNRKMLKKP
ncbi:MAG: flagellar protein FlbB [Spirochaetaceae bacterium]|nr:flagellar protein FlbB [Spirochaetaceae bacterium]